MSDKRSGSRTTWSWYEDVRLSEIRPLTNWQGAAVAIAVRKGGHYYGGELVSGGGGWEGADAANAALEKLKE
jgi:hypothetical protein